MHIKVVQYSDSLNKHLLKDKISVVIDLFRATSVITTALAHSVNSVIAASDIKKAIQIANKLGPNSCILGGEKNLRKIKGFEYGNSPVCYTREEIREKILILTTTNGTKAINFCKAAKEIYIGSMLNCRFLCNLLAGKSEDIIFVCSGSNQEFSLEDGICAGMFLFEMEKFCKFSIDDFGLALKNLYQLNISNLEDLLWKCKAYQKLKLNGYIDDINFCLQKNIYSVAPKYFKGKITC